MVLRTVSSTRLFIAFRLPIDCQVLANDKSQLMAHLTPYFLSPQGPPEELDVRNYENYYYHSHPMQTGLV